jgi:hypothetical protein
MDSLYALGWIAVVQLALLAIWPDLGTHHEDGRPFVSDERRPYVEYVLRAGALGAGLILVFTLLTY